VWVALIAIFYLAERAQLNVEIRQQTFGMSLSEVPLVIGMFLVGPLWTLGARLLGTAACMVLRHDPPRKMVFNLCLFSLECAVFAAVMDALSGFGTIGEVRTWLSVLASVAVVDVISVALLVWVIRLSQGWISRARLVGILTQVAVLSVFNANLAIVILLILESNVNGLLLLPVLAASMWVLFRSYARSMHEHRSLGQIYEFAKRVEQSTVSTQAEQLAVEAVRELLNADRAALCAQRDGMTGPRAAFADAQAGDGAYPGPDDPGDPLRERVLLEGSGLLFTTRSGPEAERNAVAERGAREVIGVPLVSASGSLGYLEVCDRRGDRLSFSAEDVRLTESLATHVSAAAQNVHLMRKLRFDALHDRLTGLPNRLALGEIVGELLADIEVEPGPLQVAVIVVDLGALAEVNDTLGHDAGDQLVRVVADVLRSSAPEQASIGRMGGDEFAVVVTVADLEEAEAEAVRLRAAMSVPCRVAGVSVEVNATLGLCVGPQHGTTAASLLQRADVALYAGHAAGHQVTAYQPAMEQSSLRRLHLATQLREAMLTGQIFAVFQPLCHLADSSIRSVETLVRWSHPKHGSVSPDEFIPLAEQIGMINPLTMHVLDLALHKCRTWLDRDLRIAVAVNLSVRTLSNAAFPDDVARALEEAGVPAHLLTFEITESSVMADPETALPVLHALHGLGVRLAIDDFGTGYSSLAYLSQLPVDEVKIDKTFIGNIGTEINDASITRAIIDLAHGLGLGVVAEGVEDELTRDLLTRMGCDTIQGYLVSRPLPGPRFDRWLQTRTAARPSEREDSGYPVWLPLLG